MNTYPTDIVAIVFKLGPAVSITSASILSVSAQKIASFPTTFFSSSLRGITVSLSQLLSSQLFSKKQNQRIIMH